MAPRFVPAAAMQAVRIVHEWSDDDPYPLIAPSDPETQATLGLLSDWAKYTFSLGCAEWVLGRFVFPDQRAGQYLDALWAHELSELYALPEELEGEEWQGPILGPTCLSLLTAVNTNYGFDEDNAELDASFAEQVTLHVLPQHELFLAWRDAVLNRLLQLAPLDAAPAPGRRLPPPVLDPMIKIDPQQLESLRRDALAQLGLASNPYVIRLDEPTE